LWALVLDKDEYGFFWIIVSLKVVIDNRQESISILASTDKKYKFLNFICHISALSLKPVRPI
jgi:hypothetical protein